LDRSLKAEKNANFYPENTNGALGVPRSASAGSNPTTPATQSSLPWRLSGAVMRRDRGESALIRET
jgi:hypothetical protein